MAPRLPSPTPSENEVDILGSLFTDDADTRPRKQNKGQADNAEDFDFDGLLNTGGGDGGDDDGGDEAFIALQQAASFRKASNLKGKSVKKGGGFQAMGKLHIHVEGMPTEPTRLHIF
jgi:ATP-dependent RNA helicase DDX54/DBP10